jgi:hypothetical protein
MCFKNWIPSNAKYDFVKGMPLTGFFLYALEIMETAKDYEILAINLQPFFWDLRSNS